MKNPILYFFLLILEILLNFSLNIYHKCDRFSKTLLEKGFKFVLYKKNNTIAFNLSLVLLSAEIDPIAKE